MILAIPKYNFDAKYTWMATMLRMAAAFLIGFALCFLRAGIIGHLRTGVAEVVPPNNYFIGFGSLFLGMGVVVIVLILKTTRAEKTSITTIY
jgi:hypothetical protein